MAGTLTLLLWTTKRNNVFSDIARVDTHFTNYDLHAILMNTSFNEFILYTEGVKTNLSEIMRCTEGIFGSVQHPCK